MTYECAMAKAHAKDCPAGENILKLPGTACDCGLTLLREFLRKQRDGYQAYLERKRREKGRTPSRLSAVTAKKRPPRGETFVSVRETGVATASGAQETFVVVAKEKNDERTT